MAGRKNRGTLRIIATNMADSAGFEEIDRMIAEMMACRLPGEEPDGPPTRGNTTVAARPRRLTRVERPRCGAKTRMGVPCQRPALENGRCPNHGGLSSGPKTKHGKARIARTQEERWIAYRMMKQQQNQELC